MPANTPRRKIIVEAATSADGYIARPDGDVTWLPAPSADKNADLGAFAKTIDTILWGRKTYEKGIAMGMKASWFDAGTANYVFSRTLREPLEEGFRLTVEPVKQFAEKCRAAPGRNIWIMGGGELIAAFLDAGEIDEFQICVLPIFIGEGIPLIAARHRLIPLELLSSNSLKDGSVSLHYRIKPK